MKKIIQTSLCSVLLCVGVLSSAQAQTTTETAKIVSPSNSAKPHPSDTKRTQLDYDMRPGDNCHLSADARPMENRIELSNNVFVGRVAKIEEDKKDHYKVIFEVEHWIKKNKQLEFSHPPSPATYEVEYRTPSQFPFCDLRFQVGERWFYTGQKFSEPSRKLKNNELRTPEQVLMFLKTETYTR